MKKIIQCNLLIMFPFIFILVFSEITHAQVNPDTLLIDGTQVNTKVLKPTTNLYRVYIKMGKDSSETQVSYWKRNIDYTIFDGKEAIVVSQVWEDKDTIFHTVKSICDKVTFAPLYQESWWHKRGSSIFDFINGTAVLNDIPLTEADTARNRRGPWKAFKIARNQYTLNWHLDMEVFPILPYKTGRTFLIPFYDPGSPAPKNEAYTVIGSAKLKGHGTNYFFNGDKSITLNRTVNCWLLQHESKGNKELFWINKRTNEVLKLEQEITTKTGTIYRYKTKLRLI
jgi:hypothetical protein